MVGVGPDGAASAEALAGASAEALAEASVEAIPILSAVSTPGCRDGGGQCLMPLSMEQPSLTGDTVTRSLGWAATRRRPTTRPPAGTPYGNPIVELLQKEVIRCQMDLDLEAAGGLASEEALPPGLMLAWEGEDFPGAGISWELRRQQDKRHILTMAEPGRHPLMEGQLLPRELPSPRR